jgi:hypothetical protein
VWRSDVLDGLNQKDDLAGIDDLAGWKFPDLFVWCVEKLQLDIDSRLDPAVEVIQDAPSRRPSMSSVAKEGRGFSMTLFMGGQGSEASFRAARLRLMLSKVMIKHESDIVLRIASVDE